MKDKNAILPILCVALGNIFWGFSNMFIKVALEYASPNVMLSIRFLLSSLLMTVWMLARRQRIHFRGKPIKAALLLMAMQILYYIFESYGILYTNATVSGVVLSVVPVVAILLALIFLKERPTLRQTLFCFLPIIGVVLMTVGGSSLGVVKIKGILLLILTCFASAAYKTANRKASEGFSSFDRSYLVITASGIFFTIMAMQEIKGDWSLYFKPFVSLPFVLSILMLCLTCSIGANLLVNYAVARMSVAKVSSFGALSTLVAMVSGVLFLKEPMNLSILIGAVLIIYGVYQVTRREKTVLDLIIKNGMIYDGLGNAPKKADIGIKDGKIVCVGRVAEAAEKVIDAAGLAISPGFIDSHSHADNAVPEYPEWKEVVEQGITTSVTGQCGSSIYPPEQTAEEFFTQLKATPLGGNMVLMIGHGALRKAVMGKENRKPTEEELSKMKKLLAEGMEQGARGLSLGLAYVPGAYAETEELIELAKVAASYGGILTAHTRNENDLVIEAVEEFITIAREAKLRGVISHMKACKKRNWGKVKTLISMIEAANAADAEIYMDIYPYVASSTSLSSTFVPKEALTRPNNELAKALLDPALRQEFEAKMKPIHGENLDWVYVTACKGHPEYAGMFVSEIAEVMGRTHYDAVYELLHISDLSCTSCFFSINEEEMIEIMKHPRSMIGTDSTAAKGRAVYHPRVRGSFPRALGHYARDLGVMPMEQMICKMTSFAAKVYGLKTKGVVAEGYDADLCIFDSERLIDHADFKHCALPNEGMQYVIVGGKIAVRNGVSTDVKAGRLISF